MLYRSQAKAGIGAAELNAIIATAQRNNERAGLTGLLLYGDMTLVPGAPGDFLQWVEGPPGRVAEVLASIREDRRHYDVEVLAHGPVSTLTRGAWQGRLFPTWSMGLVRLAELPATLSGFLRFARDRREGLEDPPDPRSA